MRATTSRSRSGGTGGSRAPCHSTIPGATRWQICEAQTCGSIRSKTREGVEQELWGIVLAYNRVRLEMERVAKSAKVELTRITFVESLRLICDEWMWLSVTSPGAIPKRLA